MNDNQELSAKEVYDLEKKHKEEAKRKEHVSQKRSRNKMKMGKYVAYTVITLGVLWGIIWLLSLVPKLPPISAENHSEDSPVAHILTTPIPDRMQRHMLEHADGIGAPGVIIQYNCDDYECDADMVEKLVGLVGEYPNNVYLAPNTYAGKIILTKLGKREVLDEFNEETIRNFIR
tara:strand:- start:7426 stop:7950 length:525 start_codon:yes stop_codon:yes gene_type:complete